MSEGSPEVEREVAALAPATMVAAKSSAWSSAEAREISGPQRAAETHKRRPDEVLPGAPHSLQKGAQL
jgi:hypothetical protein